MKIKGKWNKKTANKKADLSKIKTKTMMDLYMVMKNNPKTKKEKDAVKKLFDELKKRGELPGVKWPDPLREESVNETKDVKVGDEVLFNGKYKGLVKQIHTRGKLKGMVDVIKKGRSSVTTVDASSVKKVNESVDEAAKKADLSKFTTKTLRDLYAVLDGKANTPKEKSSVEQLRAELVKRKVLKKEDTLKITKERLKEIVREEFRFATKYKTLSGKEVIARIKASKDKNMKYWYPQSRRKEIEKMKKVTVKDLENMLPDSYPGSAIYGLWNDDEVNEVNEGLSDLEFVIDQLANSMEHYDEKEFIKHISSQTKYKAPQLKKIFQSYWKLGAMERHNMFLSGDPKPWLKKLGVK